MLTYLKYEAGKLQAAKVLEDCQVVRVVAPTHAEMAMLGGSLNIPLDFLAAATDRDERPRVETDEDCRLMVIRVAHQQGGPDTPYVTVALAVILTPTHIVTVCSEVSMVWEDLLGGRVRLPHPGERVAFLCALFMQIARQYLAMLRLIREEADAAERAIQLSLKNEMLIHMLNLEKCLVFFTTSLRANEAIWDRFRRLHGRELTEDEKDLVEDVKVEFRQAQELADIYSNILSGMMDAFASIIANNQNLVMKLLTSITIILMLPTLVASIYGMNVDLPFQHSPHAFLVPLGLSALMSTAGIAFFFKKKWF